MVAFRIKILEVCVNWSVMKIWFWEEPINTWRAYIWFEAIQSQLTARAMASFCSYLTVWPQTRADWSALPRGCTSKWGTGVRNRSRGVLGWTASEIKLSLNIPWKCCSSTALFELREPLSKLFNSCIDFSSRARKSLSYFLVCGRSARRPRVGRYYRSTWCCASGPLCILSQPNRQNVAAIDG